MAQSFQLQALWSGGMVSDIPPNLLDPVKKGQSPYMLNMLPNWFNAPLTARSAWEYGYIQHTDLTTVSASTTKVTGTNYAPFIDGNQIVIVDQSGRIIGINSGGSATLLDGTGLATPQCSQGIFHLDRFMLPANDGAHFPWYVSSNGSGTASATAYSDPFPKCRGFASWGGYLIAYNGGDFANSYTQNRRRIWFSDLGAFTYTAANNSFYDARALEEVMAVVPSGNGLIYFGRRRCQMLTGTTPPSGTDVGDLVLVDLYPYGLADYNAWKLWNGYVIFANEKGVYKTDGTSLVDITAATGLRQSWLGDMQYYSTGYTCALGVFQDYVFVTVCNASQVEQFTYVFDMAHEIGFKFSNFGTLMYAEINSGAHSETDASEMDLLFGLATAPQFGRVQPVFQPSTATGKDPNGAPVVFDWQSCFYQFGTNDEKRLRRMWPSYQIDRTTATDDVIWQVNTQNDPDNPSWGTLTSPQSTSGAIFRGREPVMLNRKTRWFQMRVHGGTGSNGTNGFQLYALEAEGRPLEGSRSSSS